MIALNVFSLHISVGDSLELPGIQFTPPKRTLHRQDSFFVWRGSCVYRDSRCDIPVWADQSIGLPISTKIRLTKALVWPIAMYGCESWTLRKNEETRLGAFEMKGPRKILRVSWTAKKINEWVVNKAGVKRELLDTVKECVNEPNETYNRVQTRRTELN